MFYIHIIIMDIYRKIAIVLIVFLFSYILFRLVSQRINIREIQKSYEGFAFTEGGFTEGAFTEGAFTEGFDNPQVLAIQKENTVSPNIITVINNMNDKSINKLYIKAAYGGGYDGEDISKDMVNYTLSLGYRYILIHVFYDNINDGNPPKLSESKTAVVGFSTTYSPLANTAKKTISLYDFVQTIQENAFSPTSPNSGDPIFLHILPAYQKSNLEDQQAARGFNTQLNSQIEQALKDLKDSNRFSKNINESGSLQKIKGKFIIVMDTKSLDGNMTNDLKDLIGLSVPIMNLQSVKNMKKPEKDIWNVVLPIDENGKLLTNNSDYVNKYRGYKINASPVCMWESRFIVGTSGKTNLGEYEQLFAGEKSAFVVL